MRDSVFALVRPRAGVPSGTRGPLFMWKISNLSQVGYNKASNPCMLRVSDRYKAFSKTDAR